MESGAVDACESADRCAPPLAGCLPACEGGAPKFCISTDTPAQSGNAMELAASGADRGIPQARHIFPHTDSGVPRFRQHTASALQGLGTDAQTVEATADEHRPGVEPSSRLTAASSWRAHTISRPSGTGAIADLAPAQSKDGVTL